MIKDLIKIADKLDSAGFFREADQIDWVVNRLVIQSNILKEASSAEELTEDPDGFGVNPEPARATTQQEWDEMGQMEIPHSYEEPFDPEYIKRMISKMSPEQQEEIMSGIISSLDSSDDEDGF